MPQTIDKRKRPKAGTPKARRAEPLHITLAEAAAREADPAVRDWLKRLAADVEPVALKRGRAKG